MTDTRLAEGFLTNPKIDALSDAAFRAYVLGLVWSTAHGTDGHIPKRAMRFVTDTLEPVAELVSRRLWDLTSDGWEIHDYLDYQTPAERVKQLRDDAKIRRTNAAQRKRAQRQREAQANVTRDKDSDVTRDKRRDDQGQDSDRTVTGQDAVNGTENPSDDDEPWPSLRAAP